jgi:hypothetical protein
VLSWQEWRRENGYPELPQGEAPYPPANMTRADGAPVNGQQEVAQ